MGKTTFAGHPLHPQLISAPAALMPFSLVMDLLHSTTGEPQYADAAYYAMLGGFIGGAAAAAAGAGDHFEIPPESHTKQIANLHASLNIGLLGLYSMNLLMRRGKQPPTGTLPRVLNLVGNAGLLVSAWYGGHMVYAHGMRVKGVSEVADAPETKFPGDAKVEEAFDQLAALASRDSRMTQHAPA